METINQVEAVKILSQHGITPYEPRAVDPQTNKWVPNTSFFDQLGERTEYPKAKVYAWLGY